MRRLVVALLLPLALLAAACGDDDDGEDAAAEESTAPAGINPCDAFRSWLATGDDARLEELSTALQDDPTATADAVDAINYLSDDPPVETPEEQEQHEAAVDTITASLQQTHDCTFDRSRISVDRDG